MVYASDIHIDSTLGNLDRVLRGLLSDLTALQDEVERLKNRVIDLEEFKADK